MSKEKEIKKQYLKSKIESLQLNQEEKGTFSLIKLNNGVLMIVIEIYKESSIEKIVIFTSS